MAYIVKKNIKGHEYYYLKESKRKGTKVISKTIAYLGKTKKDAEEKLKRIKSQKTKETQKEQTKTISNKFDEITNIAARRGFFFQTANIYGGKAGFFTYGHLGKSLKLNWEDLWRKNIIKLDENFYEIQGNNILPEEVFKASGHIENFNDPMSECKKCHFRFRADQFLEDKGINNAELLTIEEMDNEIKKRNLKCPKCNNELTKVRWFNMMFPVSIGFENEKGYLSPETAQATYITFKEEFQTTRSKLPLGLAIIDKAYRNEISPRQMFFRLREFTQAELQIFFSPEKINEHKQWNEIKNKKLRIKLAKEKDIQEINCEELNKKLNLPKFYLYYASKVQDFYLNILNIPKEKFRFRELNEKERAFYNKIHFDIEINLETLGNFKEIAGVHYRTDHDLKGHEKVSGKRLDIFYDDKKILPHVLELSFGVDRNIWMLLDIFYGIGKEGSMFKLPPNLAPIKVAILPLVKNNKLIKIGREIYNDLVKDFNIVYDESASVGRRYARQDEIGTPYCITIDFDSLKGKDITIRNRNNTEQRRVKISKIKETLTKLINNEIKFERIGKSFS